MFRDFSHANSCQLQPVRRSLTRKPLFQDLVSKQSGNGSERFLLRARDPPSTEASLFVSDPKDVTVMAVTAFQCALLKKCGQYL